MGFCHFGQPTCWSIPWTTQVLFFKWGKKPTLLGQQTPKILRTKQTPAPYKTPSANSTSMVSALQVSFLQRGSMHSAGRTSTCAKTAPCAACWVLVVNTGWMWFVILVIAVQSDLLCLKFSGNNKTMSQPFWILWIDQRCLKFKAFVCTCFDRNLLWYIPKWQGNHFLILRFPSCRFISQCSWMTASHKRLTLNTPKCYPVRTPDIKQKHAGWKFPVNLLFYMKLLDLTYRYQGVDVTIFNANCMPQGLVSTLRRLSTAQVGMNFWSNDHGDRILKVNNLATTLLVVGHGTLHSCYKNLVQLSGSISVIEIDIYLAIRDGNCTSCAYVKHRFV